MCNIIISNIPYYMKYGNGVSEKGDEDTMIISLSL